MLYRAYGFVEGGYTRERAKGFNLHLPDPQKLVKNIVNEPTIQQWCSSPYTNRNIGLARVVYYDVRPDDDSETHQELRDYWDAVELLNDTELGFGSMRGEGTKRKPPRQKGVDTLIAVDMLVGAFTNLFSVAVLVAGDADFVPVVNEVKRRGVTVVVVGEDKHLSTDLKRAADRFIPLDPQISKDRFSVLNIEGRTWKL